MSDSSNERRIQVYPNHRFYKILIGWSHTQVYSRAEGANHCIEEFFNKNFSEKQMQDFIKLYDRMTPDQRIHPGRVKEEL